MKEIGRLGVEEPMPKKIKMRKKDGAAPGLGLIWHFTFCIAILEPMVTNINRCDFMITSVKIPE
ncbi:MAG: hypothetical protein ACREAW_01295 [Nitrososphaera sp.]